MPPSPAKATVIEGLGTGGLYLTFAGLRLVPALAYAGAVLMDLAFLAALPRIWRRLAAEPFVWLALAFLVYVLVLAGLTGATWRAALSVAHPWLLVVPAWWLAARSDRILVVLGLALAGFVVKSLYVLAAGDLWHWIAGGGRTGLGMSAIPFGLYSATGALGLILLAPRWLAGRARVWRAAGWILVLGLCLQGLIVSQSRNTWLAWAAVSLPLAWWRYRGHGRPALGAGLLAAVLFAALLGLNQQALKNRLGAEWDTARAVLAGDLERIPSDPQSSLGVRAHLYVYALGLAAQRPLFGWGPETSQHLIGRHPRAELHRWTHLHNTYLEILVRLGLVGLALHAAAAWLLVAGMVRARRRGWLPDDLFLFLTGVFAMTALWALTDSRVGHSDWNFYWLLFGGIACSYRLRATGAT